MQAAIILQESASLDFGESHDHGDSGAIEVRARIVGATHGNAPDARGHVDRTEIVRDRAVPRAVPEVSATDPLAKVTHEAASGAVDPRQLETLMARGLAPDQAIDVVVRGLLRRSRSRLYAGSAGACRNERVQASISDPRGSVRIGAR
jgi:Fe-S cluster assembly scaffold protein SufB